MNSRTTVFPYLSELTMVSSNTITAVSLRSRKRINRRVDIYESVLEWNYIDNLTRTQIDNNRQLSASDDKSKSTIDIL